MTRKWPFIITVTLTLFFFVLAPLSLYIFRLDLLRDYFTKKFKENEIIVSPGELTGEINADLFFKKWEIKGNNHKSVIYEMNIKQESLRKNILSAHLFFNDIYINGALVHLTNFNFSILNLFSKILENKKNISIQKIQLKNITIKTPLPQKIFIKDLFIKNFYYQDDTKLTFTIENLDSSLVELNALPLSFSFNQEEMKSKNISGVLKKEFFKTKKDIPFEGKIHQENKNNNKEVQYSFNSFKRKMTIESFWPNLAKISFTNFNPDEFWNYQTLYNDLYLFYTFDPAQMILSLDKGSIKLRDNLLMMKKEKFSLLKNSTFIYYVTPYKKDEWKHNKLPPFFFNFSLKE